MNRPMHLTILFFLGLLSIISAVPVSDEQVSDFTVADNSQLQGSQDLKAPGIDTTGDPSSSKLNLASETGFAPDLTSLTTTDNALVANQPATNSLLVADAGGGDCPNAQDLNRRAKLLDQKESILKELDAQYIKISKNLDAESKTLDKWAAVLAKAKTANEEFKAAVDDSNAILDKRQAALKHWEAELQKCGACKKQG